LLFSWSCSSHFKQLKEQLLLLASAHSILWASTSDHTELVKDERYAAEMVLMMPVPGVDDAVSLLVEGSDDDLSEK